MAIKEDDISLLRKKIDKIDHAIIDLLKDRIEIVAQVGHLKAKKAKPGFSFIRSGREAQMLRDLTKKIGNSFPQAAIATIWRMIISASLNVEQSLKISAYVSNNDNSCYWLAREYYGNFTNITIEHSCEKIIQDVVSGKISVGILPIIDNDSNPWWVRPPQEKNDIYVFARIPFVEQSDKQGNAALAIANVMPEATEDDISIFVVHLDDEAEVVSRMFKKAGLNPKFLTGDSGKYLIEIAEFINPNDKRIAEIKRNFAAGDSIRLIGNYAAPIKARPL